MAFLSPEPAGLHGSAMLQSPVGFLASPLSLARPKIANPGLGLEDLLAETPARGGPRPVDALCLMDAEVSNGPLAKAAVPDHEARQHAAGGWAAVLGPLHGTATPQQQPHPTAERVALDQHQLQGVLCRASSAPAETAQRLSAAAFGNLSQHLSFAGPPSPRGPPHADGAPAAKRRRLTPLDKAASVPLSPAPAAAHDAPAGPPRRAAGLERMHTLESQLAALEDVSAGVRRTTHQLEAEVASLVETNGQLWTALAHIASALRAGLAARAAAAAPAQAPEPAAPEPAQLPACQDAAASMFSPGNEELLCAMGMIFSPAPRPLGPTNATKPRKLFAGGVTPAGATAATAAKLLTPGAESLLSPDPLMQLRF